MNLIKISPEQLSEIKDLSENAKFPEMYLRLKEIVDLEISRTSDPDILEDFAVSSNWLQSARSINSNDKSFFNEMVRGSMQFAVATQGRALTDEDFQKASDSLALDVARTILEFQGFPSADTVVKKDVRSAVNELGLKSWQWAGTVADQLPIAILGLGRDVVQIAGEGPEYAKNLTIAILQNAAGLQRYLGSSETFDTIPPWKLAKELNRYAADNAYKVFQLFGAGEGETPATDANPSIELDITPSPQPQQHIENETQAQDDVANGHVSRSATHRISAPGGLLNATDFASTQMAGLATGGVRPGEVQLDENVRPNAHLSSFYTTPEAQQPNFGLRNAMVLNGLSSMAAFNTYVDPLLLDLTGSGVRMSDLTDAVLFDTDHSGTLKRSGWADRATGMLVIDDGSGQIGNVSQMFSEYYKGQAGAEGAAGEKRFKHGFDALASEDGNQDGVIDASDPVWQQLRVWVDASHDAKVDAGEFKTLDELGITQISVRPASTEQRALDGNRVLASGTFTLNGNQQEMLAVDFLGESISNTVAHEEGALRITSTTSGANSRTTKAFSSLSATGVSLDAAALGVDNLLGGPGDDTLHAAPTGSWLAGGAGSNTYNGGAGDDVFVIRASDDPANIHGNGGRDTAIVVGKEGVTLNLAQAGLTIAQGGDGNDRLISGGHLGVFLKGGTGHSTLVGGAGTDVLVGGTGHNTIIGGSGKAVIYAGPNGDTIYGAQSGSVIHAGGGADQIYGGASDDVIEVGHGNASIDGDGGINLVTLHGTHGEYEITRSAEGYVVADKVAGRDGTVTLKNVQKLNFSYISAVDLQTPNAMPVPDVLKVDHEGVPFERTRAHLISAASLLANDLLLGSQGGLRLNGVGEAVGGTVSLNEQGDVLFTPQPGYTGAMGFKYGIVDAQGNPAVSVVALSSGETAPMRASVALLDAQLPGDPLAAQQWYLSDTNILPVWQDYTGKGVRIGMFEPGGEFATAPETFDIQHPDLAANVDQPWLVSQREKGVLPALASNHATMVAGVMVAGRNEQGGVGVAHGATLGGFYLANRGDDLTGLGNMVNFDVANHSWGFKTDFALGNVSRGSLNTASALLSTVRSAAHNGRGGLGTVIVTAGGNQRAAGGSAQGSLTNNNRFSIQVGAINAKADLSTLQLGSAPFSNPGASLLVSAPGSNVLSTSRQLQTERGSTFGNDYSSMQGTSFAAPIVSGIAALMLQANPNLGYRDVQQILALSAARLDDPATQWTHNGARHWNGGGLHASHDYGFGKVDARAAVRLAESWTAKQVGADEGVLTASSGELAQALSAGGSLRNELQVAAGLKVEHVEVELDATLGRLGDVGLVLVSPSGQRSVLLDRHGKVPQGTTGASDTDVGSTRSGAFVYSFMSTHHLGERSAGTWALELTDAAGGEPVTLNNWALRLYGSSDNADDTYFYTDEFPVAQQSQAERGVLDDAVNGTAGGRNTLNFAAVSGNVEVSLETGLAHVAGAALTLTNPATVHNVIGGDGNDTLVAGPEDALLHGGRGINSLTGGSGQDLFVVQRREGGQDTIHRFETNKPEVINLVGFADKSFADLVMTQQDTDVRVDLGGGQQLLLSGQTVESLSAAHFGFQDRFSPPARYINSLEAKTEQNLQTGTVVLNGGAEGISLTTGPDGQFVFALAGTVYGPDGASADRFVISHQPEAKDYGNVLRGFRHGIDKIDLSQIGVTRFEELSIVKQERGNFNGLPQIHGVDVSTQVLRGAEQPVKLLYLDTLEVSQLDANDFIFATAHLPLEGEQPESAPLQHAIATPVQPETSEITEIPGLQPVDGPAPEQRLLGAAVARDRPATFELADGIRNLPVDIEMRSDIAARLAAVNERIESATRVRPTHQSIEERLAELRALRPIGPEVLAHRDIGRVGPTLEAVPFDDTKTASTPLDPLRLDKLRAEAWTKTSGGVDIAQGRPEDLALTADQLVQAMAAFAPAPPALPNFDATHAQTVQPVLAANWQ